MKEHILEKAKKDDVKFLDLQFTDIMGTMKSVTIPIERLEEALDIGVWFDGSSIEGFARIYESDMILMPDPSTYAIIPWWPKQKSILRLICNIHKPNGKPFEGDPRFILKQTMEKASQMGFTYNTGAEVEFYILKTENGSVKPVPHDVGSYFDNPTRDLATNIRREIILALEGLGMNVEMGHHECGPGQHEIDIRYSDALKSADNTMMLKHTIKSITQMHDLFATFMPKPFFGLPGSGMHTHQSLFTKDGKNAFFDENDRYNLSKTAYNFIAGQLKYINEITAVLNPTVNSYKRLVSGYEAPVYVCWARVNRSALIRVPAYSPGREKSVRCELRSPDTSCNPYLAFALMLAAGIEGIKNNTEAPGPVEENVYGFDDSKLKSMYIKILPRTFGEALVEMERSELVRKTLGEHVFRRFLEAKQEEWGEYRRQVSKWEVDRYLETL